MTSFERVMNRLEGKPVDRIPNLSIVMMFAAKELGVSFSACCSDHRLLADAAFVCHERYGIDMVCAISDSMREADILPKGTCICGNFNPVEVMYQGTTELVKAEVRRCKALGRKNNNCIAPGCEVPKDTPPENMLALLEALKEA